MATIVADDFSPIYTGDTQVPFAPVFVHKVDNSPFNLTGAAITMKMQNVPLPPNEASTVQVCSGTWTIDNATTGQAHYTWQSADVSTPGTWLLYVTITIGGLPVHADTKTLVILPAP